MVILRVLRGEFGIEMLYFISLKVYCGNLKCGRVAGMNVRTIKRLKEGVFDCDIVKMCRFRGLRIFNPRHHRISFSITPRYLISQSSIKGSHDIWEL